MIHFPSPTLDSRSAWVQRAFEQSGTGLVLVDVDLKIAHVNGAFCRITGYPEAQLRGMLLATLTHPDDWTYNQLLFKRLANGFGTRFVQEKRYRRKDARTVWVRKQVSRLAEASGELAGYLVIVEDITDEKLVKAAKSPVLPGLFEAAQDAILIANDKHCYIDCNPAGAALFGLNRQQLRGRFVDDFMEEDGSGHVSAALEELEKAGEARGECRIRRSDGSQLDVEYTAKADFAPGLHLWILRDITERRKREEALAAENCNLESQLRACETALQEARRQLELNVENTRTVNAGR